MIQKYSKKMWIVSCLILVVTFIIVSFSPVQVKQQRKFKNLKVFPANTTYDSLDHIMDEFKVQLGVRCGYCHASSKESPKKMDMASDANPKKDICRDMMRMTNEMNKKYISLIPHADTVKVQSVTCNTCHRGQAKPSVK